MGGGLMQLVAYGAQDIYLTGNPQITFFKVVYRRHTNFAMEVIEQTIDGANTTTSTNTQSGTCTISRNGDLISKIYITSSTAGITNGDGIVNQVDLEIGGQLIDRQYGEWMQIWAELTVPESKAAARKAMCGAVGTSVATNTLGGQSGVGMVQIPLQFWFCRNPGLALPLIALQYHEVKLKIKVNPSFMITLNNDIVYNVMVDYIYLDTDERRRFAQVSHEYLIEQVQRVQTVPTINVNLNFNHPVKEIIWVGSNYTNAKLTLNGHERFSAQEEEYFQLRQPFDYHTAIPGTNIPVKSNITMMNTHLSIGTDNELNFNDFITYVQETSEISNGLVTLNENNGQNPRIGDLVKVIVKDTKLDDDSTENLYGPFEYETGGGTPDAVLDILNDDNDFSIGQLGSLTSNDNLDETKPLFIVIRIGFLGSIFSVGDILDVRINDADGSVVNRKVTVDSVREATEIDGLAGSSTIHELGLDISLMAASTRAGGTLTFAAGDTIMIQKLGKRQNKLLNIASIDNIFTNTSFSLNDVTITAEDDFQLHIIGRTQFVEGRCSNFYDMINVYSFALNPEDHQPSGTCNFSRIDNAKLEFGQNTTVTTGMLNIYAVNYNVLRIMSGMGGLAYSN